MCRVACPPLALRLSALTLIAATAVALVNGVPRSAGAIFSSTRIEYNFKEASCDFYCFWIPETNKKIDAETLKVYSAGATRCSHITYGFAYLDEKLRIVPPTDYDFIPNDYFGNFKYMSNLRKKAPTRNVKLLYGIRMTGHHQRWIDSERLYTTVARKLVWHTRNVNFDGMFLHMDSDLLFSANLEKFFKSLSEALERDGRFYSPHQPLSVVLAVKAEWAAHVAGRIALIKDRLQAVYLWADDTVVSSDGYASSSAVSSSSSSLRGGGNGGVGPGGSAAAIASPIAAFVDPLSASTVVDMIDTIRHNSVFLAQKSGMGVGKVIIGLSAWTRSYVFRDSKIAAVLAAENMAPPTTISVNATTQRRLKRDSEDDNYAEEEEGEAPITFLGHGHRSVRLGDSGPDTKRSDGRLSFYETCRIPGFANVTVKDPLAATASFIDASSSHWYSLNMPRSDSLGQKLKWIAKRGFGGIGLFSLQADDAFGTCGPQFPLHQFVASHFRCRQQKRKITRSDVDAPRPDGCMRVCSVELDVNAEEPNFSFDNLDGGLCSHIVVSPIFLHTAGQVVTTEAIRQLIDQYEEWTEESKPRLIISIGSAQNSITWRNSLVNAHIRSSVVENIFKAIEQVNAHGVEISWTRDGPENAGDASKLTLLVQELRQRLNASQEIFVGAVPTATFHRRYEFEELANSADYIIVQGYKFHFARNAFTGHHSPLFADKDLLSDPQNTIEGVMDIWRKQVDRTKLIVGVTATPLSQKFLGKAFGPRSSASVHEIGDRADVTAWKRQMRMRAMHLRMRADEPPKKIGIATSMTDVCELIKSNNTVIAFINDIGVPYLIKDDDFVAYDNTHSMQTKAIWTTLNGFAGIAINSIGSDNYVGKCPAERPFQLLRAIANAQMCPLCNSPTVVASRPKNDTEADALTTTELTPTVRRCGRRLDDSLNIICHYDSSKRDILPLSDVPIVNCDEIVVEGAVFNEQAEIVYRPVDLMAGKMSTVIDENLAEAAKKWVNDHGVSVTESIACNMSEKDFAAILNDKTRRTNLSTSIQDHLAAGGFTSVELRCDHLLVNNKIVEKFNEFLNELHTQLNAASNNSESNSMCTKTIAIRVPVWRTNLTSVYNITELNRIVSRVTIDQSPIQINSTKSAAVFAISSSIIKNNNISAFVNPLFAIADDTQTQRSTAERNYALDETMRGWVRSGLNRDHIILPVAAYGIRMSRLSDFHPIPSASPENLERIPYDQVCESVKELNITTRKTVLYDRVAGFAFIEGRKRQISFENPGTVDYKVKYARREGLAGMALTSLHDDAKGESACGEQPFPVLNMLVHSARTC